MTARLNRIVAGYPVPGIGQVFQSLAAAASFTYTFPSGPGEFLGLVVWNYSNNVTPFYALGIKVVIDTVTIYDNVYRDLLLLQPQYNGHGLFATVDIQATGCSSTSFAMKAPYESSMSIKITNQGNTTVDLLCDFYSRRGA